MEVRVRLFRGNCFRTSNLNKRLNEYLERHFRRNIGANINI